ncbi:CBS domain-containing protein [Sulfuracidifex metallicus]|jgi:CBS domain-containing protein|uniref:CBS domain-containing protein n=1 Tax=Sulfuracidifex metallicus DSM 6482 = JCM 9184 TaxID=523847 RepID=A0A6A9QME3_SULME|nr:CBS domain-containing protein [Sulfuracidifex metallicus]MUN28878.1 CBS domain-containing protein [Sulfuracidifex metallicus DSM 6482 = JCM 9184]WOE50612.1 CBS domain-containing protein [Sulfuracidifex metallicus DSM 6482 = JCM 9184]
MEEELVKEYMKEGVVSAEKKTTIKEVAKIMTDKNVGSVIVVDGNGKPIGIATERDVVRSIGKGKSLDEPIENAMTSSLITVREDAPITGALSLMRSYNIRHLPVVDQNGTLKGIISIRDIAKALDNMFEQ